MKSFYTLLCSFLLLPVLSTAQLSGTKSVPSANYPNLASVIDSLNTMGVSPAGVTFVVEQGQTFNEPLLTLTASGSENGPVVIKWDQTGIKPLVNFSGTAANAEAGLTLSGADYIVVDGLDIRTPDGLLEYGILITNADAQNGAHHNIIKNCHITLNKTNANQTEGIRVFATNVPTEIGGSVSHNKFFNNSVQNASFGYNFDGNTSTTGLMSMGNEVGTIEGGQSMVSDVILCGVYIRNQNGFTLHHTHIQNLNQTGATAPAAISTTSGNPSEPLNNEFNIYNNKITDIQTSVASVYGIYINARKSTHNIYNNVVHGVSTAAGDNKSADGIIIFGTDIISNVYNNMVSGIAAPGCAISGTAATRGINVRTFSQANVYYNSVFIHYTATNPAHISAALSVHNAANPVDLHNNIFVNLTSMPDGATGSAAAFFKNSAVMDNIQATSNNNIYYAGMPSATHPIFYGHGTTPAIDQTLAQYKARAVTFDQGSFTENVPFESTANLHIQPMTATVARGNALVITAPFPITTDIDGSLRDSQTPDIGADEIANAFPNIAFDPLPADQAENIPVQLELISWKYASSPEFIDPAVFAVFKNTTPNFDGLQPHAVINFVPGQETYQVESMAGTSLEYGTTYYWKVVPTVDLANGPEAENVPVWSFTTEEFIYPYPNTAENPSPANEAQNVAIDLSALEWEFNLLPNHTAPAGFHVYLGETQELSPENLLTWVAYDVNQSEYSASLEAYELEYETGYFWKVVPSVDQQNGPVNPDAEVWSFTTAIETFPYPNQVSNMKPAEGDTLAFGLVKTIYWLTLSFEFTPQATYAIPSGFKVFMWDAEEEPTEAFIYLEYVPGQTEYEVIQWDYEVYFWENLRLNGLNKWKVVPTTDPLAGFDTPDVEIITFFCLPVGNVTEPDKEALRIFPNPSNGIIGIGQSFDKDATVEIFDLKGSKIFSTLLPAGESQVNLSDLQNGLYILKLSNANLSRSTRIHILK